VWGLGQANGTYWVLMSAPGDANTLVGAVQGHIDSIRGDTFESEQSNAVGWLTGRTSWSFERFYATSKGYASRDLAAAAGGWMQVNPGVVGTLELGARRRVATGTSVRAALSVSRTSGSTAQNGGLTVRPSQGQRLGLSLYHQY
jgi:hypothetical protein